MKVQSLNRRAMPRDLMKMRTYLMVKAMEGGTHPLMAMEAVYSTALEHPEWNLDEERTWEEWEQQDGDRTTGS